MEEDITLESQLRDLGINLDYRSGYNARVLYDIVSSMDISDLNQLQESGNLTDYLELQTEIDAIQIEIEELSGRLENEDNYVDASRESAEFFELMSLREEIKRIDSQLRSATSATARQMDKLNNTNYNVEYFEADISEKKNEINSLIDELRSATMQSDSKELFDKTVSELDEKRRELELLVNSLNEINENSKKELNAIAEKRDAIIVKKRELNEKRERAVARREEIRKNQKEGYIKTAEKQTDLDRLKELESQLEIKRGKSDELYIAIRHIREQKEKKALEEHKMSGAIIQRRPALNRSFNGKYSLYKGQNETVLEGEVKEPKISEHDLTNIRNDEVIETYFVDEADQSKTLNPVYPNYNLNSESIEDVKKPSLGWAKGFSRFMKNKVGAKLRSIRDNMYGNAFSTYLKNEGIDAGHFYSSLKEKQIHEVKAVEKPTSEIVQTIKEKVNPSVSNFLSSFNNELNRTSSELAMIDNRSI